jgi:hypothetical protein
MYNNGNGSAPMVPNGANVVYIPQSEPCDGWSMLHAGTGFIVGCCDGGAITAVVGYVATQAAEEYSAPPSMDGSALSQTTGNMLCDVVAYSVGYIVGKLACCSEAYKS